MRRAGSRALAVAGLTAMAAGALLLARTSGYVDSLLPGFVLAGAGAGLVFPAASVTAMSSVREGMAGLASGVQTTAHEVGAALGVAVLAAVASATAEPRPDTGPRSLPPPASRPDSPSSPHSRCLRYGHLPALRCPCTDNGNGRN
jgi:MFS family permease